MLFTGSFFELKCYLKYLKRTRGIRVRRIDRIGENVFRLETKGAGTMKEIDKNTMEKIRIERTNYKGYDLVSLRVYYQDKAGEWKPSPKGITFKVELLEDIIEALESERERRPLEGSSLPPGGRKE
jgi:2,3-bisphosphoglycerate-independent phosphoglycerate mutase